MQTEQVEHRPVGVVIGRGHGARQHGSRLAGENRICARQKAERLFRHGKPCSSGREAHDGFRHENAGGGDHRQSFVKRNIRLVRQGSAGDLGQNVDGNRFRMRLESGQGLQQRDAVCNTFAESQNTAGANRNPGLADRLNRVQPILVSPSGDDGLVVRFGSVEVMIIGVQSSFLQTPGL